MFPVVPSPFNAKEMGQRGRAYNLIMFNTRQSKTIVSYSEPFYYITIFTANLSQQGIKM